MVPVGGTRGAGPALLERGRQVAAVERVLGGAQGGEGALVLVEGPAGAGKTALLELALVRAREAGLHVLTASGGELEVGFPYGVVRQLFESPWAGFSAIERGSPRSGTAELADVVLSGPPAKDLPAGEDGSFGILHGLYWFAVNLAAQRPLLLVIDDAHWADGASLRCLSYIARRLEGLPVGMVVAVRTGDPVASDGVIDVVRSAASTDIVSVGSLSEEAAGVVLDRAFARAMPEDFVHACHRATGGNPLYLRELLRALEAEGIGPDDVERVGLVSPTALGQSVLRRLAALSDDAPGLASALCIVGDGGSLGDAARLAGLDDSRAAQIARLLVRADILRDEDPVRFSHPVVRRAIYADLSPAQRESGHAAAAALLHDAGAPVERVAAHVLAAGPRQRPWCVDVLRAAARVAMGRSAADAAIPYLRRAVTEPPAAGVRGQVLRELGAAEGVAGDPAAVAHLQEALQTAESPRQRAEVALELAGTLTAFLRSEEACDVLDCALGELDPSQAGLRSRLEAEFVAAAFIEGSTIERGGRLLGQRAAALPPGSPGRSMRAQLAQIMVLTGQPFAQAAAMAQSAIADADEDDVWSTWENGAWVLVATERFEQAGELISRCLQMTSVRRIGRRAASMHALGGLLATRTGALDDADTQLRTSMTLWPEGLSVGGRLLVIGWHADALVLRGELEAAEQLFSLAPEDPWPLHVGSGFALAARGRLLCAQGRTEDGLEVFDDLARRELPWALVGPAVHHWRADAAGALLLLGRHEEAQRVITEDLQRARNCGGRRAIAINLRVAGLVEGGTAGRALLREAVDLLDESPAALERARALVELGAALRRDNQRLAAREHLEAGLRLAQHCNAPPVAQRAYDELLASGLRLTRAALDDRDALTPSELRTARLAAEGMTNREIAQSLYLSPKTVEMHLGRAYRKLGIASRTELENALPRRRESLRMSSR
jgi:DNA-binding CsgD family transcriptional regulator